MREDTTTRRTRRHDGHHATRAKVIGRREPLGRVHGDLYRWLGGLDPGIRGKTVAQASGLVERGLRQVDTCRDSKGRFRAKSPVR